MEISITYLDLNKPNKKEYKKLKFRTQNFAFRDNKQTGYFISNRTGVIPYVDIKRLQIGDRLMIGDR